MAKTELTIEARLNVSDETAAACVVLLNMYLKENAPELIAEENRETGVAQIEIRKNHATTEQQSAVAFILEGIMNCENCNIGNKETVLGNGITEPPYISLIRCPFEKEYYKYPDDECNHEKYRTERGCYEI